MTDQAPAHLPTGSVQVPEAAASHATSTEDCDRSLAELRASASAWVDLGPGERVELLERLSVAVAAQAERWAHAGANAKSIPLGTPAEAEEWLAGPWAVLRAIGLYARSLKDIERTGVPGLPGHVRMNDHGHAVAPVFPTDPLDRMLFRGVSAEVWMERGVTAPEVPKTMGWMHRGAAPEPRVHLVLGAGNVSSIGPLDALFELIAKGAVVLLKMNPVNAYLAPVFEDALAPLIEAGALRIALGGAETGAYLTNHPEVDGIHITGSDKTYDAIVWGPGEAGVSAKARGERANPRPVTAELGNVSPLIVVPGPWSKGDLAFQAANAATSLTNNAGFNCIASRVLVTHKDWDQRRAWLDSVGESLAAAPERVPYYPGAEERHRTFTDAFPEARRFGPEGEGRVPFTLIEDVDPRDRDNPCFRVEAWCGLMAETALPGEDAADFLRESVEFCNDTLWGTLSATILVHPKSLRDPKTARALEDAVARLHYGTVAINLWAGAAFPLGCTPWGAAPGHPDNNIQSGQGFVHNTYLFERAHKTVVRAPFRMWPRPAWFHDNETSHTTARRLTDLTANLTPWRLAKLAMSAARG